MGVHNVSRSKCYFCDANASGCFYLLGDVAMRESDVDGICVGVAVYGLLMSVEGVGVHKVECSAPVDMLLATWRAGGINMCLMWNCECERM
eukprot:12543310-Ditylum_brightwellii.AAC.1